MKPLKILISVFISSFVVGCTSKPEKPNILFIVVDDISEHNNVAEQFPDIINYWIG